MEILEAFTRLGIMLLEFYGVISILLLMQLVSYRVFGINLYQKLSKILKKMEEL